MRRLFQLHLIGAALLLAACTAATTNAPAALDAPDPTLSIQPTLAPTLTLSPAPAATQAASSTPPPSATQANTATAAPSETAAAPTITLLFTGDINPGRCPAQIALAHNDFTGPYQVVGDVLRAADIAVGSLDGTISDQSPPSPCPQTMNLIGPSRTVEGLTYAGFDLITVATNHAKDCGVLGWNCQERSFNDTQANLAAAGILAVGGGANLAAARAPVVIERQGVRFAFLGVTEVGRETWASDTVAGTAPLSDETLAGVLADIAAAREMADVVIVLPQWGPEYVDVPTDDMQRWAAAMLDAGATLVIGNQAHTVQPVVASGVPDGAEVLDGGGGDGAPAQLVAYALGNFIFDQGPWRNRQGLLLRATFHGAALAGYELLPIHIVSLYQPQWADPTEAAQILERTVFPTP